MNTLQKRGALIEKIILETQNPQWVAFSIGGCGILTRASIGRHEVKYQESKEVAFAFAQRVVQKIGLSSHDHVSIPQVLVDAADAAIDDPEHVMLLCTTWQCSPEGVEICSVGSNSVLVFEKDAVREAIAPHTVNELLRSQGQAPDPIHRMYVTHALGSRKSDKSCRPEDIRIARVPLSPATIIAIIEERLLVDAVLAHSVSGNELSSFIEEVWNPPGKKIRTSVLLSL